ncbi:MAG: dihydropyrimidinase [Chloroflexota bacterium]
MYDLVIKNGRVVNADASFVADIAIDDGTIVAIGVGFAGKREINAAGMLVTPGAVDIHVHMQLELPGATSSDTFFTGTRAAASGGTTAIVDFVECKRRETMLSALNRRRKQADSQVVIDYGLHMTIGPHEIDKLDQIPDAIDAGCASFKLYMAYGHYLDDGQLYRALSALSEHGGFPVIHAENWRVIEALVAENLAAGNTSPKYHPISRPARIEAEAAGRAIDIASYVGTPLHIFHVGCDATAQRIATARDAGYAITGETCPQYLMLSEDLYSRSGLDGALPVCAPPLRTHRDRSAMWKALKQGILQIVATDHCPFTMEQKQYGLDSGDFSKIPGGVPSIEARFPLIYSHGVVEGELTENEWVALCCTRPAQMFGFTRKGVIAPGYDADIVIFDPNDEWVITPDSLHENCDWTPYNGTRVTGRVRSTFVRGHAIIEDGAFVGTQGSGQFVQRNIRR